MYDSAHQIFQAGVSAVSPTILIPKYIFIENGVLYAGDKSYDLQGVRRVHILGVGKAAASMAQAVEEILMVHNVPYKGLVVVKKGYSLPLQDLHLVIGNHPIPSENSVRAAKVLEEYVKNISKQDITICLISGGASALLLDLPKDVDLSEIQNLVEKMIHTNIPIDQINLVRKSFSKLKGGGLLSIIPSNKIINVFLSDVPDDNYMTLGSGLTIAENSDKGQAIAILEKNNFWNTMSPALKAVIQEKTLLSVDEQKEVHNILIGNNKIALNGAAQAAQYLGYETMLIEHPLVGTVDDAADKIISTLIKYSNKDKFCIIWGGEPLVQVEGSGLGGRCQHLALTVLSRLKETNLLKGIVFLAAGTDGGDGPTDKAGAYIYRDLLQSNSYSNELLMSSLKNFDSYNFFQKVGGHIHTGPTYTNVMDIMMLIKDT